jgi:hypothetical protein
VWSLRESHFIRKRYTFRNEDVLQHECQHVDVSTGWQDAFMTLMGDVGENIDSGVAMTVLKTGCTMAIEHDLW